MIFSPNKEYSRTAPETPQVNWRQIHTGRRIHNHEMKVASVKREPSSVFSSPPTLILMGSLGPYCKTYLVDVRLSTGGTGNDLLDEFGDLGHDIDTKETAPGSGQLFSGSPLISLCFALFEEPAQRILPSVAMPPTLTTVDPYEGGVVYSIMTADVVGLHALQSVDKEASALDVERARRTPWLLGVSAEGGATVVAHDETGSSLGKLDIDDALLKIFVLNWVDLRNVAVDDLNHADVTTVESIVIHFMSFLVSSVSVDGLLGAGDVGQPEIQSFIILAGGVRGRSRLTKRLCKLHGETILHSISAVFLANAPSSPKHFYPHSIVICLFDTLLALTPKVEEETAKILPWPLAAAYGTESKYDVNKMEAFVVLAPSSFSSSQTIALVTRALIKTLLLHIPTIQYLYTVAQACPSRLSKRSSQQYQHAFPHWITHTCISCPVRSSETIPTIATSIITIL
ncbi:hypothetical protein KCV06_g83, partial [Aureobasidium melanogenum]